ARLAGCPCVLGSATPALESWENASEGRYRILELPERVTGHGLPGVELIDLKTAGEDGDDPGRGGDTAPGERCKPRVDPA
ncbi:MAG: hypothetical protein O7I42_26545, partial [Alphaproteobacteria bacterium]|nr:hypothetical protein [Alphaproteobacteria bacterium]